jgi:hypothetical protein
LFEDFHNRYCLRLRKNAKILVLSGGVRVEEEVGFGGIVGGFIGVGVGNGTVFIAYPVL